MYTNNINDELEIHFRKIKTLLGIANSRGLADGLATLDGDGLVPVEQIPDLSIRPQIGSVITLFGNGIDGLTTGVEDMFSTVAGLGDFAVLNVRFVPRNISGSPTIIGNVSIGYSAAAYADIVSAKNLAGAVVNVPVNLTAVTSLTTIPPSSIVKINKLIAFTGYTEYEFDVHIVGYYTGQ